MAFNKNKAKRAATATAIYSGRTVADIVGLVLKAIGTLVLLALTTGAIFAVIFSLYIRTNLEPQIEISLEDFTLELTSVILHFDHEVGDYVEAVPVESGVVRHWVEYEEINPYFIWAAVAFEDRRFFEHRGVDWFRTVGAFHHMFLGEGPMYGASTITQQLIKNLTQEAEVTVRRKILEIFRAMELERLYTKEEILEWYLNVFALGGRIIGIEGASQFYFGINQSEATIAQAASIVGITQFPTRYNPTINPQYNIRKRNEVLGTMYAQGFITLAQFEEAINEELILAPGAVATFEAPVYTFHEETIINDLIREFQVEHDLSLQAARNMVFYGGLQIFSTVDNRIQAVIDSYYLTGANLPLPARAQSSILIMDHHTGHILGMAGGIGEKTQNMMFNRAIGGRRPPGSSIKPISVFGPAMEFGVITPQTMELDAPIRLQGREWPRNASGVWSRANVNMVHALAQSLNTVPVRVLDDLGASVSYEFMTERLHINLMPEDADRAPLALGQITHGLTLREMTAAYSAFANGGIFSMPVTYSLVLGANDEVIFDHTTGQQTVIYRAEIANQMTAMLLNAVNSGTGTAARISGFDVAGKTGSTDRWRDRWFAGYTPHLAATVWSGFDQNDGGLPGQNPSAVIFSRVMRDAHAAAELPPARFQNLPSLASRTEAVVTVEICYDSGLLATEACHLYIGGSRAIPFVGDSAEAPEASCTIHVAYLVCGVTDMLPNETCETHIRGFRGAPGICGMEHHHQGEPDPDEPDPGEPDPGEPDPPIEPSPPPTPPPPDPTPSPDPDPDPSPDPEPDPPIDAALLQSASLPPSEKSTEPEERAEEETQTDTNGSRPWTGIVRRVLANVLGRTA